MVAALLLAVLSLGALSTGPARPLPVQEPAPAEVPSAQVLQPLRDAAGALVEAAGRAPWFTGVALDAGRGVVDVWVSDPARARTAGVAGERTRGRPGVRVVVHRAPYARAALDRAARDLLAGGRRTGVTAVAVPPDGSALRVEATDPRRTRVVLGGSTAGIPVDVVAAVARVPKAGVDDAIWHDSAPFVGGDLLTSTGRGSCTAGLPAVRRSDGRQVLVTAGHCFGLGTRVFTGAGPTWQFGNGRLGDPVGTVVARSAPWDAAVVLGAPTAGDLLGRTTWQPLDSAGYSYVGDWVCQVGARSAAAGHHVPCGIRVTDDDLWFPIAGHLARGVEGVDVVHGWGSINGDSGATVFTVLPGGRTQARGQVSSGGADGTPDQRRVDWVEAPDILRAFGLVLNPRH